MKKIVVLAFIILPFLSVAQKQFVKDTVITDSTALITIKQLNNLVIFYRATLTYDEYNKVYPGIEALVKMAIDERKKKHK